jgi:hypothetical protein
VTTIHPGRIVAGLLLLGGGFVVAVTAFAITVAKVLVDAGVPASSGVHVSTTDARLLNDLVAVIPFVVAFAVINVAAAIGLFAEREWAPSIAAGAATVATIGGVIGLTLVLVGRDPFARIGSAGPSTDGVEILAAFTVFYAVVLMALAAARPRATSITGAAA